MKFGDYGGKVVEFQKALIALGYALPKYGADGSYGRETHNAADAYADDVGIPFDEKYKVVPDSVVKTALEDATAEKEESGDLPASMVDYREEVLRRRKKSAKKRTIVERNISHITGITLHQTATFFNGRCPFGLEMHFIAHRNGESQYLNDVSGKMWQAQRVFNARDVGIECDGYYSGIGVNKKYFWKPKSRPNRKPMTPTDELISCTRETIKYICEEVGRRGGEIKYIHAHRQTSNSRTSDPGSLLWQALGIWAQDTLGLSDGGKGKVWLKGQPIPEAWDPRYVGVTYR